MRPFALLVAISHSEIILCSELINIPIRKDVKVFIVGDMCNALRNWWRSGNGSNSVQTSQHFSSGCTVTFAGTLKLPAFQAHLQESNMRRCYAVGFSPQNSYEGRVWYQHIELKWHLYTQLQEVFHNTFMCVEPYDLDINLNLTFKNHVTSIVITIF